MLLPVVTTTIVTSTAAVGGHHTWLQLLDADALSKYTTTLVTHHHTY